MKKDSQFDLDVDQLAQEIRRVDGSHNLGAGKLAEALQPFIVASLEVALVPYQAQLALLIDLAVPGQNSGDLFADAKAAAAALEKARPTLALIATGQSPKPVAWMSHHAEPMFFTSYEEAEVYCDFEEDPIPLHDQAVFEIAPARQTEAQIEGATSLSDADLRRMLKKAGAKNLGGGTWEWECSFEELVRNFHKSAARRLASLLTGKAQR